MGYNENIMLYTKEEVIYKYSNIRSYQNTEGHIPYNFIINKNKVVNYSSTLDDFINYIQNIEYELIIIYCHKLLNLEINNFEEREFINNIVESYDDTRKKYYGVSGLFHINLQFNDNYNKMLDLHKDYYNLINKIKKEKIILERLLYEDYEIEEDLEKIFNEEIIIIKNKQKIIINDILTYSYKYTGDHSWSLQNYDKIIPSLLKYKNKNVMINIKLEL